MNNTEGGLLEKNRYKKKEIIETTHKSLVQIYTGSLHGGWLGLV